MVKISLCNMRLTGVDKLYYANKMKEFAGLFSDDKINSVEFGKQDIRGGFSITLLDKKWCVPAQKHFTNKWEMLGYIVGYVDAVDKGLNWIGYLKGGDEDGRKPKE